MITAVCAAQDTRTGRKVRNERYCEILLANGSRSQVTIEVYNTSGLNDCPENQWQAFKPNAVAKEFHARKAIMNGPRYFMMDTISERGSGEVQSFSGLQMRKVATFQMKPTGERSSPPYKRNKPLNAIPTTGSTGIAGVRTGGYRVILKSPSPTKMRRNEK
jgi:hypothetical protein